MRIKTLAAAAVLLGSSFTAAQAGGLLSPEITVPSAPAATAPAPRGSGGILPWIIGAGVVALVVGSGS